MYFVGIHVLPDPVISEDGHYKHFSEVYGMPDLNNSPQNPVNSSSHKKTARKRKKPGLGFNASQQHVRNVDLVLQCEECGMWRLLFSKKKLNPKSRIELIQGALSLIRIFRELSRQVVRYPIIRELRRRCTMSLVHGGTGM